MKRLLSLVVVFLVFTGVNAQRKLKGGKVEEVEK